MFPNNRDKRLIVNQKKRYSDGGNLLYKNELSRLYFYHRILDACERETKKLKVDYFRRLRRLKIKSVAIGEVIYEQTDEIGRKNRKAK